jgi:hypothetical protein
MANALVRLMRVLKKFVMLVSITRFHFIGTRLPGVDADQTMANGKWGIWEYASSILHCPAFDSSHVCDACGKLQGWPCFFDLHAWLVHLRASVAALGLTLYKIYSVLVCRVRASGNKPAICRTD